MVIPILLIILFILPKIPLTRSQTTIYMFYAFASDFVDLTWCRSASRCAPWHGTIILSGMQQRRPLHSCRSFAVDHHTMADLQFIGEKTWSRNQPLHSCILNQGRCKFIFIYSSDLQLDLGNWGDIQLDKKSKKQRSGRSPFFKGFVAVKTSHFFFKTRLPSRGGPALLKQRHQ
jgi:hypothetical protein